MLLRLLFSLPKSALLFLFDKLSIKLVNDVFQRAKSIKPYRDLLEKSSTTVGKIRSLEDLKKLPQIDKKSYISKYHLSELLFQPLSNHYTVERSSGYTGKPNYWPRYKGQDNSTEMSLAFALDYLFETGKRKTLIFNTFALGTWVAGVKISKMLLNIANDIDSKITVVNVGVNNKECLEMWMNLYTGYEQTLIMGYNPVVKELLEMAKENGLPFEKHRVNLLIGGEGFSEEWREYVANMLHFKIDDYDQKIVSGYAAADPGVDLGFDYPICTFVRRLMLKHPELKESIFKNKDVELPLFFQYVPNRVFIEEDNGELLFTSNNSIPLIRYNLHDRGGVVSFRDMEKVLASYPEYEDFRRKQKILPLPFVYVWGRSDGTIALLGAKIYIENIKTAVLQTGLQRYCTGKFHTCVDYNDNMQQQLNIVLETESVKLCEDNVEEIKKLIIDSLQKSNSEYRNAYHGNPLVATPKLKFLEKENFDSLYSNGIKVIYN